MTVLVVMMSLNKFIRQFSRIPFDAETHIIDVNNNSRIPCTLLDISLNGALIQLPTSESIQSDNNYKLEVQLGSEHEEELCLHMDVRVTHIKDDHIGLQIEAMDIDTASHLHRIIELNTGDPDILERELAELIKQHENEAAGQN